MAGDAARRLDLSRAIRNTPTSSFMLGGGWVMRWTGGGIVVACAALLALGGEVMLPRNGTAAVVICKKGKRLTLREACKSKETPVPATELGVTGPQGEPGETGDPGAPGTFATALGSGQTIRGNYNIGGTAAALGALANTSISFITSLAVAPTAHLIRAGEDAPPECPGNATMPEATAGHLCIYENADRENTSGISENLTLPSGSTIFITAAGVGAFYSYGAWAVTAP